jgi:Leucine-rich repeat (LRR) protein
MDILDINSGEILNLDVDIVKDLITKKKIKRGDNDFEEYYITKDPYFVKLYLKEFSFEKVIDTIPPDQIDDNRYINCEVPIRYLQGIEKLKKLQILQCPNNNIISLAPLYGVKDTIEEVIMNNNKLNSLFGISKLEKLKYLSCQNNNISNINDLIYLSKIKYLNLKNNKIVSISSIRFNTELIYLNLSNNFISNINDLGKLKKLQYLYFNNNNLKNIDIIKKLPILSEISIDGNDFNPKYYNEIVDYCKKMNIDIINVSYH